MKKKIKLILAILTIVVAGTGFAQAGGKMSDAEISKSYSATGGVQGTYFFIKPMDFAIRLDARAKGLIGKSRTEFIPRMACHVTSSC